MERAHPMPGYDWMQPQEIADMVSAYLESIAPKEMSNKKYSLMLVKDVME